MPKAQRTSKMIYSSTYVTQAEGLSEVLDGLRFPPHSPLLCHVPTRALLRHVTIMYTYRVEHQDFQRMARSCRENIPYSRSGDCVPCIWSGEREGRGKRGPLRKRCSSNIRLFVPFTHSFHDVAGLPMPIPKACRTVGFYWQRPADL